VDAENAGGARSRLLESVPSPDGELAAEILAACPTVDVVVGEPYFRSSLPAGARRHGLNTRAKRLSLVAGYAAPTSRRASGSRSATSRPHGRASSSGWTASFVGRLGGTKGSVWQLTAIDVASSFAWTDLVSRPRGNPTGAQTSRLARQVAAELADAGWRLERALTDNGGEFRSNDFRGTLDQLGARHTLICAGRPQTNGAVEALHRLILEECWRPAFARYLHVRVTGLKRDLAQYVDDYNFHRVHHGCLTRGRIPADIVYGAPKVTAR
jgi:transposase InsO family protein